MFFINTLELLVIALFAVTLFIFFINQALNKIKSIKKQKTCLHDGGFSYFPLTGKTCNKCQKTFGHVK